MTKAKKTKAKKTKREPLGLADVPFARPTTMEEMLKLVRDAAALGDSWREKEREAPLADNTTPPKPLFAEEERVGLFKFLIAMAEVRYEGGDFTALKDAVYLCSMFRKPPEGWIVDEIVKTLDEHFKHGTVRERGGLAHKALPRSRNEKAQRDKKRWRALDVARTEDGHFFYDPRCKAEGKGPPTTQERDDRKRALKEAHKLLKKIKEDCLSDEIEESWERVQAGADRVQQAIRENNFDLLQPGDTAFLISTKLPF